MTITFPKQVKKPIQCYEPEEIKLILDAFSKNIYNPKSSRYKHSYYYPYVSFLSLVGCRPEEALALVKEDIRAKGDRTYIRFNKSYSKGILLPHTKTHEIRLFPVNEQLKALLTIVQLVGHREAALAGKTQSEMPLEEAQASIRAARLAPSLD
ncbi:hypothetical protein [Pleurocapsa sp. CCALA 161]|uniref:hypothetical protein n=1 Tax=Pleurocapsa sp. CCALA 161 TaxID=2107688 RepID=UPI0011B29172|nr:hypothetical protein [Pleurocapsa sp. CCALA 161]